MPESFELTREEAKRAILEYHCSPETTAAGIAYTDVEQTVAQAAQRKLLKWLEKHNEHTKYCGCEITQLWLSQNDWQRLESALGEK